MPAGRSGRLVLGGLIAVLLLGAGTSPADRGDRAVVVRDAAGDAVAREALPEGGGFALAYRHSYYRAPAREVFRAGRGDGFVLRALESPSAAVLDYYALSGRRTRGDGRVRLVLDEPQRYSELPLIATSAGRRMLVVGDRRVPLYGDRARHLVVGVEGGS